MLTPSPGAVIGAVLLLNAGNVFASTPPTHDVTVPMIAGETVVLEWTGTIQAGAFDGTACDLDPLPTGQVDRHAITLSAPDGSYGHVNVHATFHVEWDDASQNLALALVQDGTSLGFRNGASPSEDMVLQNPSGGVYEAVVCTFVVTSPTAYRGRLTLTALSNAVPVLPMSGDPRYQQQESPPGIGDDIAGEMNVGFNPRSGRYMLLADLQTLRMTTPEDLEDAVEPPSRLPETCPAEWQDMSFATTSFTTADPILSTDPSTGRTFVAQLDPVGDSSIYAFTDDDGDTWTPGTLTITGGIDHQTIVSGPYAPGQGPSLANDYPDVVTYCSAVSLLLAACTRSDDGGLTFGPPVVISSWIGCSMDFFGLHGHLRYGADGTIYLPIANCNGHQDLLVSEDSGRSYQARPNPNASLAGGDGLGSDASIAPSLDGSTLYHCYMDRWNHIRVSVSHDKARSWTKDFDVAAPAGIQTGVFPAAVAGDPDRASCAFIGTTTAGNYQAVDFPGIWHVYIATTYDGGRTWRTVSATPGNPVQGVGGICTAGLDCGSNRNLLDFNDMVMDRRGYPLYAYDDGCVGSCDADPVNAPTQVAKAAFVRQIGGRGLLAQFDALEPTVPHRTCLSGTRFKSGATLNWPAADSGGATVTGYRIFRGTAPDAMTQIATTGVADRYTDDSVDPAVTYYYKIAAFNEAGDAMKSNALVLKPSDLLPETDSTSGSAIAEPAGERDGGALTLLGLFPLLLASAGRRFARQCQLFARPLRAPVIGAEAEFVDFQRLL